MNWVDKILFTLRVLSLTFTQSKKNWEFVKQNLGWVLYYLSQFPVYIFSNYVLTIISEGYAVRECVIWMLLIKSIKQR